MGRAALASMPSMTTSMAKRNQLVAVAGDELCGVGGDERELVGRKAGEHGVELVGERVAVSAPHVVLDGGVGHQRRENVGGPGCVLGVEPAGDPKLIPADYCRDPDSP